MEISQQHQQILGHKFFEIGYKFSTKLISVDHISSIVETVVQSSPVKQQFKRLHSSKDLRNSQHYLLKYGLDTLDWRHWIKHVRPAS